MTSDGSPSTAVSQFSARIAIGTCAHIQLSLAGYDFGYLLKLLTASSLPADDNAFFTTLHAFFPYLYDVKQMCTAVPSLSGGLSRVANALGVPRAGQMHQAGSDSLLTSAVFSTMVSKHFNGRVKDAKHRGVLYGLSSTGNHGGKGGAASR